MTTTIDKAALTQALSDVGLAVLAAGSAEYVEKKASDAFAEAVTASDITRATLAKAAAAAFLAGASPTNLSVAATEAAATAEAAIKPHLVTSTAAMLYVYRTGLVLMLPGTLGTTLDHLGRSIVVTTAVLQAAVATFTKGGGAKEVDAIIGAATDQGECFAALSEAAAKIREAQNAKAAAKAAAKAEAAAAAAEAAEAKIKAAEAATAAAEAAAADAKAKAAEAATEAAAEAADAKAAATAEAAEAARVAGMSAKAAEAEAAKAALAVAEAEFKAKAAEAKAAVAVAKAEAKAAEAVTKAEAKAAAAVAAAEAKAEPPLPPIKALSLSDVLASLIALASELDTRDLSAFSDDDATALDLVASALRETHSLVIVHALEVANATAAAALSTEAAA